MNSNRLQALLDKVAPEYVVIENDQVKKLAKEAGLDFGTRYESRFQGLGGRNFYVLVSWGSVKVEGIRAHSGVSFPLNTGVDWMPKFEGRDIVFNPILAVSNRFEVADWKCPNLEKALFKAANVQPVRLNNCLPEDIVLLREEDPETGWPPELWGFVSEAH